MLGSAYARRWILRSKRSCYDREALIIQHFRRAALPLRAFSRRVIRLGALVGGLAIPLVAACAERADRGSGTVAATATRDVAGGRGNPQQAAPADTVDSLAAARRATVMDTTYRRPVTQSPSAAPRAADSAAVKDTSPPKTIVGMIGPRAGDRHLAFRGTGSDADSLWPVKGPEPLPGSILPGRRIIAYYGNPLSKRMGILGEFPPDVMLAKLDSEVEAWTRIDPDHPAQPALHLIVLVADAQPGSTGKYRTRHDSAMVEKVYGWAKSRNALLFLDLQVGQSTLQYELPWVEKFLKRPDVHLGIDPEFAMKKGGIPGKKVGTYDAADVNFASHFLASLVDKYKLPPKILVVHRFTPGGVTNTRKITLDPRVQVVMHMDGFGPPWMKRDTYWRDIKKEPVQFTGWKQFTKARNDRPPTPRAEILRLWPVPLYIQIQ
ncbi:hypothetical protein BH09GEM1_BH09GEM1_32230 [soil metagenome]